MKGVCISESYLHCLNVDSPSFCLQYLFSLHNVLLHISPSAIVYSFKNAGFIVCSFALTFMQLLVPMNSNFPRSFLFLLISSSLLSDSSALESFLEQRSALKPHDSNVHTFDLFITPLEEALLLSGGCQYTVITAGLFLQPQQVVNYYSFMVLYFIPWCQEMCGIWPMASLLRITS